MSTYKTRPIGEVFRYGKLKLKVVETEICLGCYFSGRHECFNIRNIIGYCSKYDRKDRKSVIFKRIYKEL